MTALAEVPYGAHPTACYPFYAYDRRHTAEYCRLAGEGMETFRDGYLKTYVEGCPQHADYLQAIGGVDALERLAAWKEGAEAWKNLYV